MAGFLLQEIIKSRGPMLATWIQFWDHWSTTLLTGTVSPGQASRCLSNSRCSQVVGIAAGSSEFSKARKACLLLSRLSRHSSPSFSLKYLSFSKSIIRNFLKKFEIQIFSRTDKSIQCSGSRDDPRLRSISIWNLNMVWIHKKKFSCVGPGHWTEGDVIRKKVNCSRGVLIFDN